MTTASQADLLRQQLSLEDDVGHDVFIEDIAFDKRVIPLSRSRHVRGWHPVKPRHGAIGFESKLECDTISALATHAELEGMRSQPVTVTYIHEAKRRVYTPDFMVYLSDVPTCLARMGFGSRTCVEVKPLCHAQTLQKKLSLQFAVIRRAIELPIVLLTECDVPLIFGGVGYAR
jgi:hypothetical protein